MELCPYTDDEWDTLPHVFLTNDIDWDPAVLDHEFDLHDEQSFQQLFHFESHPSCNKFDEQGNFLLCEVASKSISVTPSLPDIVDSCIYDVHKTSLPHVTYSHFFHHTSKASPSYDALHPYFAYLPTDIIKKTFENTTQYGKTTVSTLLKWNFHSPHPALNVCC